MVSVAAIVTVVCEISDEIFGNGFHVLFLLMVCFVLGGDYVIMTILYRNFRMLCVTLKMLNKMKEMNYW